MIGVVMAIGAAAALLLALGLTKVAFVAAFVFASASLVLAARERR